MTDRDRLIELLCRVECEGEGSLFNCPERRNGNCRSVMKLEMCQLGAIADYLIANGITVQERRMYTHDELKTMNGQPVWVEDLESWALIEVDESGQWAGIPFAYARSCYWNVIDRNLRCWNMPEPPKGVGNGC